LRGRETLKWDELLCLFVKIPPYGQNPPQKEKVVKKPACALYCCIFDLGNKGNLNWLDPKKQINLKRNGSITASPCESTSCL